MILLALLGFLSQGLAVPLPDTPATYGGFQPLETARGTSNFLGSAGSEGRASSVGPAGGAPAGPSKTIFVNVPEPEPSAPAPPIAAGPPRKHYKIVFIRAPTPPRVQPIIPPKTEQKTIIYVLHQKQQQQPQQVIQTPSVKHNPEVYFVQYDNPPTADELQQLSTGDLSNFGVSQTPAQTYGSPGDSVGAGSAPNFDVRASSSQVGTSLAEANAEISQPSGLSIVSSQPIASGNDVDGVQRTARRVQPQQQSGFRPIYKRS